MNEAEIMVLTAGPEIDALVHVNIMGGKCYHLNRKPVNPHTIRQANGAKDVCLDCGWRTYTSDFRRAQKGYSRSVFGAKEVIERLAETTAWRCFVDTFDELAGPARADRGDAFILKTLDPLFVCQAALISKLKRGERV